MHQTFSAALELDLLHANQAGADHNRAHFDRWGVTCFNLMSGPGAGKTALLERTLEVLTRSMAHRGVITCCGMITGTELKTNVFPFILRGLTLVGIDSAECPYDLKVRLWNRLSGEWTPKSLEPLRREIGLQQAPEVLREMLNGGSRGRVVVRVET